MDNNKRPTPKTKPYAAPLPRVWGLEARLMFDAAAVAEAVDAVAQVKPVALVEAAPPDAQPNLPGADAPAVPDTQPATVDTGAALLQQGTQAAVAQVQDFLRQTDALDRLAARFPGGQEQPGADWLANARAVQEQFLREGAGVQVQAIGGDVLRGALGAFAAAGPDGAPVVYVNADWLRAGPDAAVLQRVLLEELGHVLDVRLNGAVDTRGDEGEAFALDLLGLDGDAQRIAGEDDGSTIVVDGREVAVEEAAVTFSQVWQITPGTRSEEANDFTTAAAAVAGTKFKFTSGVPSDPYFSGNNVAGTLSYVDAGGVTRSIAGVVSRLVKTGSTVDGFYFYVQGPDGAIGTADDTAYLFKSNTAFTFAGNTAYNTSSDPVDRALNALIVPNRAPTAGNDTGTVLEDGSATGNLLANDADPDLDTLRVSGFTVGGVTTTIAAGSSATRTIAGVGDLQVSSSGTWTFTPAANHTGAVPVVSYTVTDGTATSTATLALSITPVNDAPAGTARTVSLAENRTWTFSAGDFGFTDTADSPAHALASVVITTLPTSGTLRLNGVPVTQGQEITAANLALLVYTPVANAASSASFTFQVRDNGGTANLGVNLDPTARTFTFAIANVNEAPVAGADTATVGEAGGTNNATNPTPNVTGSVFGNDTDADVGDTRTVSAVSGVNTGTVGSAVAGKYGSLVLGAGGTYTYTVDNASPAVQALRLSTDTLSDVFTYTVTDTAGLSSTTTLSITITGANDSPDARDDANTVKEAATATAGVWASASGNVVNNDVDVDGGTLVVDQVSTVVTVADADVLTVTSPITSATYTVIEASTSGNWTSGVTTSTSSPNTVTINGIAVQRSDGGGVLTVYRSGSGGGASLVFNHPATLYTYGSGTTYGVLGSSSVGFRIDAITPTVASSTFLDVTGGTLANVAVGDAVSGTGITAGTTVVAIDSATRRIELSQAAQITKSDITFTGSGTTTSTSTSAIAAGATVTIAGNHGNLVLSSSGAYTYNLTDNSLNDGQVATETFTYRLGDSAGGTDTAVLSIRIDGRSAVVVAAAADSYSVSEDTTLTPGTGVLANDTAGSTVSSYSWGSLGTSIGSAVTDPGVGTLTLNADGSFTFTPATNFTGAVPPVVYTITNGAGRASAVLSITVNPANDAPAAVADTAEAREAGGSGNAVAGHDPTGNVLSNDTDADRDALAVSTFGNGTGTGTLGQALAGTYGSLTLRADGSYSYVVNNGSAVVQALAAGQSVTDVFSYTASDGSASSSSTLTVTIRGANDAPVNTASATHTQTGAGPAAITGLSVADPDGNLDSVTLRVASGTLALTGTLTGVTGNGTDTVTITGTQTAINALLGTLAYTPGTDFTGADTLRIASVDTAGLTDVDTVAITVNPDNRPLTVSQPTVNEASPFIVFTVGGAAGQRVSLALAASGTGAGHAVLGTDSGASLEVWTGSAWAAYTGGMVSLDGSGSLLVRTTVLQDQVNEGGETLALRARNAAQALADSGGTSGTGTIVDDGSGLRMTGTVTGGVPDTDATSLDDDRPLTVSDIDVNEGAGHAVFTVTGSAGQVVALSLRDATAGTADHGSTIEYFDGVSWVAAGASLTLPAGGSVQVRVTVADDTVHEGPETFSLVATNLGGREFQGVARILDDGTGSGGTDSDVPTLSVSSPTVAEAGTATFTVSLDKASVFDVSFTPTLGSGSATLGTDTAAASTLEWLDGATWRPAGGVLTIPAGSTSLQLRLATTGDTLYEPNETFTLSTGAVTAGTVANPAGASGTATITDDDAAPVFSVANASASEGGQVTFTVTRTGDAQASQSVNWATSHGTAGAADYTAGSGTLTFAQGETTRTFTVQTLGDALYEGSEAFTVALGGATAGATVSGSNGSATGTITDDDAAPVFSVANASATEGGQVTFTVTRTGDAQASQSVNWATSHGTAGAADYTAGSGTLTFAQGETTRTFTVQTAADALYEGDETFSVALAGATAGATVSGSNGSATGTVVDGVLAPLVVSSPVVNEASPTAVFTVTGTAGQPIALALVAGSAQAGGTDFGATAGSGLEVSTDGGTTWTAYTAGTNVTVPGSGTVLVRTPVNDDGISDNNETFALVATPAGGPASQGTATIRDDGTGTVYGPTGSPDPTAIRSDDRAVTVTSPVVNEGSPTAVFTVTGTAGQQVTLALAGGSATAGGTDFGASGATNLEVSTDGGTSWVAYTGAVTLPAGGSIQVRTPVNDDGVSDNNETFTLSATPVGGVAGVGTATIKDDGTGTVYGPTGAPDPTAVRSDDRAVTVTSPVVNEGSPMAVFTVSGTAGQVVTLTLAGGSAQAGGTDFGAAGATNLQVSVDGGATWTAYAGSVTLPAGGSLLVRTPIHDDGISDNNETFTLSATPAGGVAGVGTATIRDDGTGSVFGPGGAPDPAAEPTDDRPLAISSPRVNEASPYAVFTVTGAAGQRVRLGVEAGSADGNDYGGDPASPALQVWNGSAWVAYAPGTLVQLDAAGRLLVRTAITPDTIDEGAHTFTLRAASPGGSAFRGEATIDDHGGGDVWLADATGSPSVPGSPGYPQLDDDRPKPVAPPAAAPVAPAPAPVVAEVAPAPAPAPQRFDSALVLPMVQPLGDLRAVTEVPVDAAPLQPAALDTRDATDIYTRSSGFRAMVVEAPQPQLRLFRGVEDQVVPLAPTLRVQVPADAFVHTERAETVTLVATLLDGTPLPSWLRFDGKAGTFQGEPPQGAAFDLRIRVTARDSAGREATAMFRLRADVQRPGLSGQLQRGEAWAAGGRGFQLQRAAR